MHLLKTLAVFGEARIYVIGQHREILGQVVDLFGCQSEYDMRIMKVGQELAEVIAAIQHDFKAVLARFYLTSASRLDCTLLWCRQLMRRQ